MRHAEPRPVVGTLGLLVLLALAGCATPGPPAEPVFRDPALTPRTARDLVVPGRSTRDELVGRLGEAPRLRFDNGWEVWAWRSADARGQEQASELVVLFDPGGIARKVRLREGHPPAPRRDVRPD